METRNTTKVFVQIGWGMIIMFTVIYTVLLTAYVLQWGSNPISSSVFTTLSFLILLALLVFYKLEIRIVEEGVELRYGLGIVRFKIKMKEIHEMKLKKMPFFYGMGIRITPFGMLYNVNGFKTLEIKYVNRKNNIKRVFLGTVDPEKLKNALKESGWGNT